MNLKWNDTMNLFKYGYIFLACLLSACATHQRAPESTLKKAPTIVEIPTNKTKQPASTVSSWELSGAMAARNEKKGWNASFHWAQQGLNQYQIRLNGPLGGGSAIIKKENGLITYADGTKKASSSNADELLLKQTGIQLPVNNLYYWVRGLAAPGAVTTSQFDEQHRLISLTQAGYTIHYTHYLSVNQIELPGKIELHGHGVVMKLVIKHWSM
jgi:outer membrane lipoprotein LolB